MRRLVTLARSTLTGLALSHTESNHIWFPIPTRRVGTQYIGLTIASTGAREADFTWLFGMFGAPTDAGRQAL